jgi:hypothetical protein
MTFIERVAGAAISAAMLIGLSASSAQAGYVVDLTEQAGNVVATGSGAIDLTGLSYAAGVIGNPGISPVSGIILTGPATPPLDLYIYSEIVTGPTSFGTGNAISPAEGSGDMVGLNGFAHARWIYVPAGYVSDTPLSDTSTYIGQTFSSLGVTPGRYEWTWGSGANQNFTLVIGATVPEPSTWAMMLIGFAGLGYAALRLTGRLC